MRKVKHNKIRNTGLLFEFLLRQITSDVLNKDQNSKAVTIVKQKFNENTELGKELALYNILITKKFKSDSKANYKTYASIYKLFEYNTLSPDEKTESFFNIVEHVTTEDKNIKLSETVKTLPDDEDLRILTYRTLLEKFNQKYTKLSGAQKNLLREYINNVSNTNSLKDTLKEIVKGLKEDLQKHSKNLKDEVVKIKMTEAIKSINEFCGLNDKSEIVKDEYVIQTMRYLELIKELKKSGNKKQKVI